MPLLQDDEVDGNVDDDMEGAMEAIGMRGPIYGVLQNAALMIFVLDTAIGLCVWVPFTIGKTSALLSLDPPRLFQLLHFPIRAIRMVTDPIVDSVVYVMTRFLMPLLLKVVRIVLGIPQYILNGAFNNDVDIIPLPMDGDGVGLMEKMTDLLQGSLARFFAASPVGPAEAVPSDHLFPPIARPLEPYFVILGSRVRTSLGPKMLPHLPDFPVLLRKSQDTWIKLALGTGPSERVFAILLGYAVFGLGLAVYLNVLTVGNARTAGRAVRSAVRQQLVVLKVAGFIFIELVLFPFACGLMLDACTLWMSSIPSYHLSIPYSSAGASLQSRIEFFGAAPVTAMFYHWVGGTLFMYSFAILLSGCRAVMRPGAMWFIKDPSDQNSHPIRDILERPTLLQLRKICVSALMYAVVVACAAGSLAGLLLLGKKSILPFRWKTREPLSNVPIDLLVLHLLMPQTLRHFRPRRVMKYFATQIWRALAGRLRLTSYFFGGRYPDEEVAHNVKESLTRLLFGTSGHQVEAALGDEQKQDGVEEKTDGTFRRVPAVDNIALPRDMKATAEVTADGHPANDEAVKLMHHQNLEALKARRDIKKDYMVAFIPPHFRYRVIFLIIQLWVVGAVFLGASLAMPILLGRSFFGLWMTRELHDGYSFVVGFYLLWGCYLVAKGIDRLEKQQRRLDEAHATTSPPRVRPIRELRPGVRPKRKNLRVLAFKRSLFWIAKLAYVLFLLGIVVPVLLAFVFDLYVVLPIRTTLNPGVTPKIRVVDSWALGLLYAKILVHIGGMQAPGRMTRAVQNVMANGWMGIDPLAATRELIAPLVGVLLGMILLPAFLLQLVRVTFPGIISDAGSMFMAIYPAIFIAAALAKSSMYCHDILSKWSQSIRDKEFLVELRLKNHDPEPNTTTTTTTVSTGKSVGVQTDHDEFIGPRPPPIDD